MIEQLLSKRFLNLLSSDPQKCYTVFISYLKYVLRHKWYVFLECVKLGIPIRGITHDLSKFLPDEFIPYALHFYGGIKTGRDETGYYKPTDTGDPDFEMAWLLHQKRNDHHWQWWILPEDDGGTKILEMSEGACKEMLADWRGAGKATHSEWLLIVPRLPCGNSSCRNIPGGDRRVGH